MINEPVGYLITLSTYGSWLPGDPRGSVSHRAKERTDFLPPSVLRQRSARERMRAEPMVLEPDARDLVDATIFEVCRHRGYTPHAVNVRGLHGHVVVSAPRDPDFVAVSFKSWTTRRLVEAGLVERGRPVWARGQSTRYLWSLESLARAVEYVDERQGAPLTSRLRYGDGAGVCACCEVLQHPPPQPPANARRPAHVVRPAAGASLDAPAH